MNYVLSTVLCALLIYFAPAFIQAVAMFGIRYGVILSATTGGSPASSLSHEDEVLARQYSGKMIMRGIIGACIFIGLGLPFAFI